MDGNRRFAKREGLPIFEGHRRGYEKLKELMQWAKKAGIGHVIVFAFSTENWNRSQEEVSYLLDLFKFVFTSELGALKKEGIRVRCTGDRARFLPELQTLMARAETETETLPGPMLVLALSYGGRSEILHAVNELLVSGVKKASEKDFEVRLWTKGVPDPDLIIRTSGEMRLSGFFPWQSVYSELFFTRTLWPDFSEAEFNSILEEFAGRERRVGK